MNFPTCWDDSKGLGDTGDHMSHMAYTVDGTVEGACPEGYNRRLPQIQLFVRVKNYEGGQYTFSDNTLPGDEGKKFFNKYIVTVSSLSFSKDLTIFSLIETKTIITIQQRSSTPIS